jgi:general secretion pathway protein G
MPRRGMFEREALIQLVPFVGLLVLSLAAARIGPQLFGRVGQSKRVAARVQIELLGAVLDEFKRDTGRYPTSQEGLRALRVNPGSASGWAGPYLKKDIPRDPWGNAYQYKSPDVSADYDLASYGSDGALGGEGEAADITNKAGPPWPR